MSERGLRAAHVHSRDCFAALPRAWAEALLELSRKQKHYHSVLELSWSVAENVQRAYVGWDGAISAPRPYNQRYTVGISSVTEQIDSVLELDADFGNAIDLPDGSMVTLKRCKNVPTSKCVFVEPSCENDWEIMELNANLLEERLLKQIKAVYIGQVIPIYVNNQTTVRIRSHKIYLVEFTPADVPCVLLDIDTEIVIAPKLRKIPINATTPATNSELIKTIMRAHIATSVKDENMIQHTVYMHPLDIPAIWQNRLSSNSLQLTCILRPLSCILYSPELDKKSHNELIGDSDLTQPIEYSDRVLAFVKVNPLLRHGDVQCSLNVYHALHFCQTLSPRYNSYSDQINHMHVFHHAMIVEATFISTPTTVDNARVELIQHEENYQPTIASLSADLSTELAQQPIPVINNATIVLYTYNKVKITMNKEMATITAETILDVTLGDNLLIKSTPLFLANDQTHSRAYQTQLDDCLNVIENALTLPSGLYGILIQGQIGCGKTTFIERLLQQTGKLDSKPYTCLIECAQLIRMPLSSLKIYLEDVLRLALWYSPSLIAFDDIDKLIPAPTENADSTRSTVVAHLLLDLCLAYAHRFKVIYMFSARTVNSIHSALQASGIIADSFKLGVGGKPEREQLLREVTSDALGNNFTTETIDFSFVASETEGYVAADLKVLALRAQQEAVMRVMSNNASKQKDGSIIKLLQIDFNNALINFTPRSLQGVKLEKSSSVSWRDIGGLDVAKRMLLETLEWPHKYAKIFSNSPLRLRSGILLYGYPGCGKTLLASAVAKECNLNFISVKGPELLNKYIGASEAGVRELFDRAHSVRPCVLFFDEFDAIAPRRGSDNSGVTDRVVNQLLTQLDGAEGLEGVYVLAATSRPDMIDPALLRPGRLDKSLLCDLPTRNERLSIMQAICSRLALTADSRLDEIVEKTKGYSGADLQGLVNEAHLAAIHMHLDKSSGRDDHHTTGRNSNVEVNGKTVEYVMHTSIHAQAKHYTKVDKAAMDEKISTIHRSRDISSNADKEKSTVGHGTDNITKIVLQQDHLVKALSTSRPSVSEKQMQFLRAIYDKFANGRVEPAVVGAKATMS